MNQTCENLKRSQCFSFYFAAESTEQSRGCFNCGDESEVAGIKSANLFLCDDLKPIRMLRASGSLTCLLCVKVTVRRLRVTLLPKICTTTRGQLHKYGDRQMCLTCGLLLRWLDDSYSWQTVQCLELWRVFFFVTSWVINLWAVEMNKHCCFTDRLTSMSNVEKTNLSLSPLDRPTPGRAGTWWARRPWWRRCGRWTLSPRCTPLWVCCWSLEQMKTKGLDL